MKLKCTIVQSDVPVLQVGTERIVDTESYEYSTQELHAYRLLSHLTQPLQSHLDLSMPTGCGGRATVRYELVGE